MTMWMCRSREHQWPLPEHAEMCCHTHQLQVHFGAGPNSYTGPEPVLPFNGMEGPPDLAFCWILVAPDAATERLELASYVNPSELHPYYRDRLGPWRPGIYADREIVSVEIYERAATAARISLRRRPKPPEVEPYIHAVQA